LFLLSSIEGENLNRTFGKDKEEKGKDNLPAAIKMEDLREKD